MMKQSVPLSNVCEFIRGVTFDKSEVSTTSESGKIRILRAGNIAEHLDFENDLIWVPDSRVDEKQRLKKDDIVICMSSGSPEVVGKTARVERSVNASVGSFCGIIRPKNFKEASFISYYFKSAAFKKQRDMIARGANIQNLRFSSFEDIEIELPEQYDEIAEQLDEADRLCRLRRYALEMSESFLRSVFVENFGDPERNPKGWDKYIIDDVIEFSQYGTSQKNNSEKIGYPVLGMANVTSSGELDLSRVSYVDLPEKDFETLRLQSGDIIFNRTNSTELVGKTACWRLDIDAVLASYLIRIQLKPMILPEFFSALLNTSYFKKLFQERCKKAVGQSNISPTLLKEFSLYVPPMVEQRKYVNIATYHGRVKAIQAESLRQAEHLFQSLLHQAFNEN